MIRVLAGKAKARRLYTPKSIDKLRPTSARVKEAIFSILGDAIQDANVADLFAGTGALGIESISRGANQCIFFDDETMATKLIEKNIDVCGFDFQATVKRCRLPHALQTPNIGWDIIFLDPPYRKQLAQRMLGKLGAAEFVAPRGAVVAVVEKTLTLDDHYGYLVRDSQKCYGDSAVHVYRRS